MMRDNSLAAYISCALHTEPNSKKRYEMLLVLKKLYCNNPDDLVLKIICEALAGHSIYGAVTYNGKHAAAFSLYFNNSLGITCLREEISAWAKSIAQQHPEDDCLNLADLGCGDGQAIGQVIQQSFIFGKHKRLNLFLNDPQAAMLKTAQQHIQLLGESIGITNLSICNYQSLAQDPEMPKAMQSFFGQQMSKVIITAVASIHHMPYNQKIVLLQQLAAIKPRLIIIGDANSEHDIHHLPKSPQIIANTMRFYNGSYTSLKKNGASEEVLEAAQYFLGSEARNIIMNDLDKRIDYHTTVENWKAILQQAGFELLNAKTVAPYLTNKANHHINTTHCDTCIVDGEPLCFSLAAKVSN